jgi:Uma2 family endonuclease
MKLREILKSPVFPGGKKWALKRRPVGYESDITALVRGLVEDESIREDQRWAWERWRNDATPLKNK